tara:strand:- start:299 stop:1537 length:1239 start_codon:yes stop_codon:yes gene_type:complete
LNKKIYPCILGLGYVGLPVFLRLNKKFRTTGFDTNKNRVTSLTKKIDTNKEVPKSLLTLKNKSYFTYNKNNLKKCNFFIVTVPTPLKNKNIPDLKFLIKATQIISKHLKKNDIIVYESTVYPGTTQMLVKSILEKKSKFRENKDFFVGYSPERVNPGDKEHSIEKISKILAVKTKNKKIKKRILTIYNQVSKKIHITDSLEDAETAKVIENIQRDLNIALMNDIYIFSKKMKLDFNNIIKLASTKWNFLKFSPGLVGGHCLPVDPHYLNFIAKKNNIKLRTVLAGRDVNFDMKKFILKEIDQRIRKIKRLKKKIKILVVGVTYKKNVSDLRNSLALEIYYELKKRYNQTKAFDEVCSKDVVSAIGLIKKINYKKNNYDLTVFLVDHNKNKIIFNKMLKNKSNIYDPFGFHKV